MVNDVAASSPSRNHGLKSQTLLTSIRLESKPSTILHIQFSSAPSYPTILLLLLPIKLPLTIMPFEIRIPIRVPLIESEHFVRPTQWTSQEVEIRVVGRGGRGREACQWCSDVVNAGVGPYRALKFVAAKLADSAMRFYVWEGDAVKSVINQYYFICSFL